MRLVRQRRLQRRSRSFQFIAVGDTVCGTFWALGGDRDTDWFEFELETRRRQLGGSEQRPQRASS